MKSHIPPPGICARGLSLAFGERVIFNNLTFSIDGGGFTALLGASGVGKSSLLKVIAGLYTPTSGTVLSSDGQPINGRMAYMGQKDLLYPWLTIEQNVMLGARLRGEKANRNKAIHLLEQVGLRDFARALPESLSGGMRQRAAIARTLYEQQPIILMDEPFSALDTITRTKIQNLAVKLLCQHTVLLITHDPMEACRLSQRILVLSTTSKGIDDTLTIAGKTPRSPDDPALLQSQAQLLQQLMAASI